MKHHLSRPWTIATEQALVGAGWHPGRRRDDLVSRWRRELETEAGFRMMETAEAVLLEFGGIAVSKSGPGVRNARGGVVMDPMLADGEEDRFLAFSTFTSWPTFPLGEVYGGYAFLGVNREGVVFMIGDSLYKLGDDIYEALDVVLEGRRYPIIAEDGQW